ncbi:hypothetical protein D7X33_19115 [Butyricicoccus sp. 1XD8-22]|nr:hypothetical protein D7X33_19115 [Butyricicoccus sp. 1XD8-22]
MILTNEEKKSIANMNTGQLPIKFDDEIRSNYQYEVEKPSDNEWRVSKFAIMCLAVDYFTTAEEVYKFIEN